MFRLTAQNQIKRNREPCEIVLNILQGCYDMGAEGITFNRLLQNTGLSSELLESYLQRMDDILEVKEGRFKDWKGKPAKRKVMPKVSISELEKLIRSYEEFLNVHKQVLKRC